MATIIQVFFVQNNCILPWFVYLSFFLFWVTANNCKGYSHQYNMWAEIGFLKLLIRKLFCVSILFYCKIHVKRMLWFLCFISLFEVLFCLFSLGVLMKVCNTVGYMFFRKICYIVLSVNYTRDLFSKLVLSTPYICLGYESIFKIRPRLGWFKLFYKLFMILSRRWPNIFDFLVK